MRDRKCRAAWGLHLALGKDAPRRPPEDEVVRALRLKIGSVLDITAEKGRLASHGVAGEG